MESRLKLIGTGMTLTGLLLCSALAADGSLEIRPDTQAYSNQNSQPVFSPPESLFSCIQLVSQTKRKHRAAILHGPDWLLSSSIEPPCLPGRDVAFTARVGEGLIPRPFNARTRLWVTRDRDATHIKIVESSGDEEQDMVAASFVTNHRCVKRSSKNCSIKGGAALLRID